MTLSLFLKQVLANPRQVSAVAPSSDALAKRMAEAVPEGKGNVVELGAGTGKITQALFDAGVPSDNLYSFEVNADFCALLKQRYPALQVFRDSAENLVHHEINDVKAVVSGLPLLSMDRATQRAIVVGAFSKLRSGGIFIQFTYGLFPPVNRSLCDELSISWKRSETIWGNLPPATSYVYFRKNVT